MASLVCRNCKKSLITAILKQEVQMRSILNIFVEDAPLHFEEIIDTLISARVLQTKHHVLLTSQGDRTQFARKLWTLLLRLPPRKFKKHVEPLLESCGFFTGQEQVYLKDRMCLRCVIEHMVPIEHLADKLMVHGCLRSGEHRDAIKSNMVEISKWKVIFDSLQREHHNPQVLKICEEMLQEYDIPMPDKFTHILKRGLVCVCGEAASDEDGLMTAVGGSLCNTCQRHSNDGLNRSHRFARVFHADICQPADDQENDAEIRQRSCRNFRKQRMADSRTFQKEILKAANQNAT